MQRFDKAFSSACAKLARAASQTMQDMAIRALPEEPTITAALVTRWRDALNGYSAYGIGWSARILSSLGPHTEESKFGADFLGVLKLDLPNYAITKGFLAQAKCQEPGSRLSRKEWDRLKDQCEKMLALSAESFVFVYSLNGVFMLPAINVLACSTAEDLHTLHPRRTSPFYKEHFHCFIGERRIDSTAPDLLEGLSVRRGLEISAVLKGQLRE